VIERACHPRESGDPGPVIELKMDCGDCPGLLGPGSPLRFGRDDTKTCVSRPENRDRLADTAQGVFAHGAEAGLKIA
jgi:hypothetical protein